MSTHAPGPWLPRLATMLMAALAAASLTFWGLRLAAPGAGAGAPAAAAAMTAPDASALSRVLGAAAPAAAPAVASLGSRFVLIGVVAGASQKGAALIAVDGKPPKPYRVGATVDEGLVLQSVATRRAVLAPSPDGPPAVTLELPPLRK